MTNLFKIASTDWTPWEKTDKHNVNKSDVYTEWTDGNWKLHRVQARTQITGTVVLSFAKAADYSSFLSQLSSARNADGYYSVTVYCSNSGTTETIDAFLTVTGETKWDLTTPRVHQSVTVSIVGR